MSSFTFYGNNYLLIAIVSYSNAWFRDGHLSAIIFLYFFCFLTNMKSNETMKSGERERRKRETQYELQPSRHFISFALFFSIFYISKCNQFQDSIVLRRFIQWLLWFVAKDSEWSSINFFSLSLSFFDFYDFFFLENIQWICYLLQFREHWRLFLFFLFWKNLSYIRTELIQDMNSFQNSFFFWFRFNND